jgi:hypothetical protein
MLIAHLSLILYRKQTYIGLVEGAPKARHVQVPHESETAVIHTKS